MTKQTITHPTRRSRWPALALACLTLAGGHAWAVDDVVVEGAGGAQPAGIVGNAFANVNGVVVANAPAANNANNAQTVIDQWFFPRNGASQKRTALELPLAMQLSELRRSCNLSDAQTRKMALAMQYDVQRFFDDIDELRVRHAEVAAAAKMNLNHELFPMIAKSQTGDLCGPDSFFEKTLQRVLEDEQLAKYHAIVDERLRRRYLTAIEVGLREFEERVPLDSRQHEAVRRLLVERPLPRVIPWRANTLILYRLSQIPSEQLEPLFEERHWSAFNQDRQRFAAYREHLRQVGLLQGE